jgi:hypothetical protein
VHHLPPPRRQQHRHCHLSIKRYMSHQAIYPFRNVFFCFVAVRAAEEVHHLRGATSSAGRRGRGRPHAPPRLLARHAPRRRRLVQQRAPPAAPPVAAGTTVSWHGGFPSWPLVRRRRRRSSSSNVSDGLGLGLGGSPSFSRRPVARTVLHRCCGRQRSLFRRTRRCCWRRRCCSLGRLSESGFVHTAV